VRAADLDDAANACALASSVVAQALDRGQEPVHDCSTAATCIAVGNVSFDDWRC
jgi:hypothetical protein